MPIVPWWRALQARVLVEGGQSAVSLGALFASFNVFLLPGGFLMLAAGALFGLGRGFLIVLMGNCLGAAIAFGIGRIFGRPWVNPLIARSPRVAALAPVVERGGWRIIVLSQLNPLFPTSLLVYLYSLTNISFWSCMLLVAVARIPGILLYVYLGSLGEQTLDITHAHGIPWLGIVGMILTIALLIVLARTTKRQLLS